MPQEEVRITGKHIKYVNEDCIDYLLRTDGKHAIPVTREVYHEIKLGTKVDVDYNSKGEILSAFFWTE